MAVHGHCAGQGHPISAPVIPLRPAIGALQFRPSSVLDIHDATTALHPTGIRQTRALAVWTATHITRAP